MSLKNKFQWNLKRARRDRLKIIEPRANELQIDLDGARALRRYGMQYAIFRRAGLTRGWLEKIVPSRKRDHVHVTITLPRPITDLKRVCMQAILGSDLGREAFNFVRVAKRNRYPIVFFEKEKRH